MRILVVCHRLPYPPDHGGKIRAFEMIKHLGAHHTVTVATLAHNQQQIELGSTLRDYCQQLIVHMLPSPLRWARALLALPSAQPSSASYFWSPRLKNLVDRAARATPFDRILVHCAFMAHYVTDLPCGYRVLDYADIDSGKWSDYCQYKRKPLAYGYALEAAKLRRHEREMGAYFAHCCVTTNSELTEFNSLGLSAPCSVIPNGVDFSYFTPQSGREGDNPVIVFVGRMDYFPNVDGVLQFARDTFPRIRAEVPNVELRIIGSDPTRTVLELAQTPGIRVTGYVPDIRPHVTDATLAIAPLRIARGTQNKILEMMACGIPVVASPQAAKGIQATPGEHLVVGANAEDFACQVIKLLRTRDLRQRFSHAGRRQVERAHSWRAAMRILDRVLQLPESAPDAPADEESLTRPTVDS
jgi:sugar transferase (PEP-CTERM/EpsH1 system associated)